MSIRGYMRIDLPLTVSDPAEEAVRRYTGANFCVPYFESDGNVYLVPGKGVSLAVVTEMVIDEHYLGDTAAAAKWNTVSPLDVANNTESL